MFYDAANMFFFFFLQIARMFYHITNILTWSKHVLKFLARC